MVFYYLKQSHHTTLWRGTAAKAVALWETQYVVAFRCHSVCLQDVLIQQIKCDVCWMFRGGPSKSQSTAFIKKTQTTYFTSSYLIEKI